jgi:hypothetical protein
VAAKTGDPNITGLATSLNSLVNSYARAINPKGTPTVSDKNHAREIINAAMSSGQLSEAFTVMRQEMAAANAAAKGYAGGGGAAPAVAAPTGAAAIPTGAPIYASNGKERIMSTDGGNTWHPVK